MTLTDDLPEGPERKAAFLALREQGALKGPSEKERPEDLPGWVKAALVRCDIEGETYAEAAAAFGKAAGTLGGYARSPGGKAWRAAIAEITDDPALIAKGVLEGAVADASATLVWAVEAAKRAGDFKEARIGAAHLLDRLGVQKKESKKESPTIVINLPGGAAEPTVIEAETEIIEDEPPQTESAE